MKAWSLFLKDVMPHVPGCPEPVAEHAIRRAAQEFFEATRVWRLWLTETETEDAQTDYSLFLETKSELVRLERATLDGRDIEVRTEDDLPADWKTYPTQVGTGVHTSDRKTVVVLPPPAAGLVLLIEASLKPSNDALGIEAHLFEQYVTQIACGAVAALKEHAGKTYSDATGSLIWRARFDNHMSAADFKRYRGFSSARPRRQIKTF